MRPTGPAKSAAYAALLQRARAVYSVSPAERVEGVLALLTDLGAVPIDFDRYQASLADEFVDPDLVVSAVTILDPALLEQRGTSIDRQ